ncbi:MAG: thiosulfate oxidation carrier complex protein SoxZ [Epsilonproteobacteria bacterium]|nr:thiosulfate oxidation carrier complex protein SoxZ [Campylobacterota bacterium]
MAKARIRAKAKKDHTEVKMMIKHPMLTYLQAKKAGKEANFITYVVATVDDKKVFEVSTSQFLSKDPYFKFSFKGNAKGKELVVTWVDLKGKKESAKAVIK